MVLSNQDSVLSIKRAKALSICPISALGRGRGVRTQSVHLAGVAAEPPRMWFEMLLLKWVLPSRRCLSGNFDCPDNECCRTRFAEGADQELQLVMVAEVFFGEPTFNAPPGMFEFLWES